MKKIKSIASIVLALLMIPAVAVPASAEELVPNTGIIVTPLGSDVYMLDDMGVSTAYLIIGDNKALVIDSGIGNKNFYNVCKQYAKGRPLECAVTHAHPGPHRRIRQLLRRQVGIPFRWRYGHSYAVAVLYGKH